MNLYDYNTINKILTKHGFTFSKALGQNFLIDSSVCPAMASSLNADEKTGVLEVGPGIGVLTKELSAVCGKVAAVELDKRLLPVLDETLTDCNNIEIFSGDIMKLNLADFIKEHFDGMEKVKVCANLPYYITSPVVMMLLQSNLPIDEIVVMVQKEAAERLCADVGSRDSGAITIATSYYAQSEILFEVPRTSFMPSPKVDSAVIRLTMREKPAVNVNNESKFFLLIKGAFAQRRKTFVNSVCNSIGVPKSVITDALSQLNLDADVRAEKLTMAQLGAISDIIFEKEENSFN